MFYQQKFLVGKCKKKNEKEIFIAVAFYIFDIHTYGEFYTENYRKIFFRTVTRKYMSLNAGMELPT